VSPSVTAPGDNNVSDDTGGEGHLWMCYFNSYSYSLCAISCV